MGELRAGSVALALLAASPAHAQGIGLEELKDQMSWGTEYLILVDELEVGAGMDETPLFLESIGWVGGAVDRAWYRVEGEQLLEDDEGEIEAHAYYGRLISPWWDFLAGVRADGRWGDDGEARAHLAVGLIGLAPLRFELAPTLFLSHEGDVSARLEAEYQVRITQRLVATPEAELNVAIGDAPEWEVETGFNDLELALRVRYDIVRELGPYLGVRWEQRFGDTADLARRNDEPVSDVGLVAGTRFWF